MPIARSLAALLLVLAALVAAGCGDDKSGSSSPSSSAKSTPAADACAKDQLKTAQSGQLTVGTDKPAYPPYFEDDDPTNGKGFESAVAYAIAEQLGFDRGRGQVDRRAVQRLLRAGREEVRLRHQPDLDHAASAAERVDFSEPYYTAPQAVVALKGSDAADATSLADLADAQLGVQIGTTSLDAVDGDDQARRSSRRCSTTPTTPSARSSRARSTRSSSTSRPRST